MPKRIPSKLPQVSGTSTVAEGFRLAFDKINEIIDYLESVQPAPSADSLTEQSVSGIVRRPKAKPGTEEAGGDEARWA